MGTLIQNDKYNFKSYPVGLAKIQPPLSKQSHHSLILEEELYSVPCNSTIQSGLGSAQNTNPFSSSLPVFAAFDKWL